MKSNDEGRGRLKLCIDQPCQLIAFPLHRRVGKVRRVAEVYAGKRGKDAKNYWCGTVDRLGDHLDMLGYEETAINDQLCAFRDAVNIELERIAGKQSTASNSDGAA